jgi:hypothetical protein
MIYFIQNPSDQKIKIGYSSNPNIRKRQLQTGSSSNISHKLLLVLPGGRKREKDLHQNFYNYHSHNEWFEPTQEIFDFIKLQTIDEFIECRVCGGKYLSSPMEPDIKEHCKLHKTIRLGAYPYHIREFMKTVAWQILGSEGPTVEINAQYNLEDIKRVIVYAWWSRERQKGMKDIHFEDYILDYMEYMDVRLSDDEEYKQRIKNKLMKHWNSI